MTMTEPTTPHAPNMLLLSAYFDDELGAADRQQVAAHLIACPPCAARLAELQALAADFDKLPQETLGYDLAGVIEGQLPAAPRPRTEQGETRWWGLLPVSVGAAASVAIGIAMGSALFGGGAALPRVTAMSVFDAIPPGGLCLGLESCYDKGVNK